MKFTIFALLIVFSGILLLAGAIRRDKILQFGSGAVLLLLASSLLITGLEFQTGMNVVEENIDNNTTEITKNRTYTSFQDTHGADFSTEGLSLILLALGFYLSVYAVILGDGRFELFRKYR